MEEEMFIHKGGVLRGENGFYPHIAYYVLNKKNDCAKNILRSAKKCATIKHTKGTSVLDYTKAIKKLDKIFQGLKLGEVNILSAMYMIDTPTTYAMATGAGGIVAMASDIVNERARLELKNRPSFVIE